MEEILHPFVSKGLPYCTFCLKPRADVAQLFMSPGAEGMPGTAFICDRCISTFTDVLRELSVPHNPNDYCRSCGFELLEHRPKRVLRGRICRSCAYEIGLWCLGIPRVPTIVPRKGPPSPDSRWFELWFRLNTPARNRPIFWAVVAGTAVAGAAIGWFLA